MSETSRRVRLIHSIGAEGAVPAKDLANIYDEKEMISARLDRLVSLGQVSRREGRYFSAGLVFPCAAIIFFGLGVYLRRPWPAMAKFRQKIR